MWQPLIDSKRSPFDWDSVAANALRLYQLNICFANAIGNSAMTYKLMPRTVLSNRLA
jgi:hypothetical protein